ncbi:hypothetical protein L541_4574, partial [Bordetella hinzii CA90 BAL1384]
MHQAAQFRLAGGPADSLDGPRIRRVGLRQRPGRLSRGRRLGRQISQAACYVVGIMLVTYY